MSKFTTYPEPANITQEYMHALREEALTHFKTLYTTDHLITVTLNKEAGNKLYGSIVNLHFNSIALEQLIGSANAELMAKDIKATLLQPLLNIESQVAIAPEQPSYQPQ